MVRFMFTKVLPPNAKQFFFFSFPKHTQTKTQSRTVIFGPGSWPTHHNTLWSVYVMKSGRGHIVLGARPDPVSKFSQKFKPSHTVPFTIHLQLRFEYVEQHRPLGLNDCSSVSLPLNGNSGGFAEILN